MNRRVILRGIAAAAALQSLRVGRSHKRRTPRSCGASPGRRDHRLRSSVDINSYPNGDVPRSTGVCADVIIRAARDAFGLDLQKLVHEDMMKHFDAYPSRRVWGEQHPDTNIDHRRVLNLETYFKRCGACLWPLTVHVPGDEFPQPLETGDIITWLLDGPSSAYRSRGSDEPSYPLRNCRLPGRP